MKSPCHLLLACWLAFTGFTGANTAAQPNNLHIVTDDMGYSDLGCYGGEIQPPILTNLPQGACA